MVRQGPKAESIPPNPGCRPQGIMKFVVAETGCNHSSTLNLHVALLGLYLDIMDSCWQCPRPTTSLNLSGNAVSSSRDVGWSSASVLTHDIAYFFMVLLDISPFFGLMAGSVPAWASARVETLNRPPCWRCPIWRTSIRRASWRPALRRDAVLQQKKHSHDGCRNNSNKNEIYTI